MFNIFETLIFLQLTHVIYIYIYISGHGNLHEKIITLVRNRNETIFSSILDFYASRYIKYVNF